jgi:hypothetical protein
MIIEPPEAPIEGRKTNLSKVGGQIFLRKRSSKSSLLVSCKHIISQ